MLHQTRSMMFLFEAAMYVGSRKQFAKSKSFIAVMFIIYIGVPRNYVCASKQLLTVADVEHVDHKVLPPVYHIDEYESCLESGNHFCRVILKLQPGNLNATNLVWKYIQMTQKHEHFYNRDELYHAVCVEKSYCNSTKEIENVVLQSYKNRLYDTGLDPLISEIDCIKEKSDNLYVYDWLFLCAVVFYLTFTAWATSRDTGAKKTGIKTGYYLPCFNLKNGWNKLIYPDKPKKNPDFDELKSMQGLRFYTMVLIVFFHTYASFAGGFVANTEYFEDKSNVIKNMLKSLAVYLVQVFFLLSSWLMSYHFFQAFEKKSCNKTRYIFLSILNRYFRLLPLVIALISLELSTWITWPITGPVQRLYFGKEIERCRKTWWTNLLFINNHYDYENMCFFISWYVAADFQLYVISIFLLYLSWKLREHIKKIFCGFLITAVSIQIITTYIYNTDFLYRLVPRKLKLDAFLTPEINKVYTSTYCNMATYMVGLVFGYVYYNKDKKYKNFVTSKFFKNMCWIAFPGLPTLVIWISCYKYNKLVTCVLAGISKPLFATGLGIGILGMSTNNGYTKIFGWRPFVILGRVCFSTYISHYGLIFSRPAVSTSPVYVTDSIIVLTFVKDLLRSFLIGIMAFLLIEQPMMQLQNLILPQARNERYKQNAGIDNKEK